MRFVFPFVLKNVMDRFYVLKVEKKSNVRDMVQIIELLNSLCHQNLHAEIMEHMTNDCRFSFESLKGEK